MLLTRARIRRLLADVAARRLSAREALDALRALPYDGLGEAALDTHRSLRLRYPEAVLCEGKSVEQVLAIVRRLLPTTDPLILTRISPELADAVRAVCPSLRYHAMARMGTHARRQRRRRARRYALILTAGTSDVPVAAEAQVTLELFGHRVVSAADVGVAGLHRLVEHLPRIQRAAVVIVVAGMDGALPSVIGGLAGVPVIAVPTSVGYGATFRGIGPLLTMLNTCAPGVAVVNIDNGFGAGYLASLMLERRRA